MAALLIALATAFVAAPSLMAGAIEVLVPLRIDDLGGGATLIAAAFVAGAAIEATFAPISGRYSDRVGPPGRRWSAGWPSVPPRCS